MKKTQAAALVAAARFINTMGEPTAELVEALSIFCHHTSHLYLAGAPNKPPHMLNLRTWETKTGRVIAYQAMWTREFEWADGDLYVFSRAQTLRNISTFDMVRVVRNEPTLWYTGPNK